MKFKKKTKGLWYSDDTFFGAVLLLAEDKEYRLFCLIKGEDDDLDPEDALWTEEFTAKTQKAAVEKAEELYGKWLAYFIKAAKTAKKKN